MILELKNIEMRFRSGDSFISVLNGVNFSMNIGEGVALVGPSGSGKSTLLQIAALLEQPTSGNVIINGLNTKGISDEERTKLRRENLGFVYQFHNLLPEFSALENVMIPQLLRKIPKKEAEQRALDLLNQVELSHRIHQSPKKLSGGEQQRVAIARALANNPTLIIADEPTGNLDPKNSEIVFDLLLNLVKKNGMSVFMATHNMDLATRLDRIVTLSDGKLEFLKDMWIEIC